MPAPNYMPDLQLAHVQESPTNPRKQFDAKKLEELTESIGKRGVANPILVRPLEAKGEFEVVCGHRRVRAARAAGLVSVPANVAVMSDLEVLEIQLVELSQREDVHPLEEAEGFRQLHETFGQSIEQIAAKVGRPTSFVAGRLKLCTLGEVARELLAADKLSLAHAMLLCRLDDPEKQAEAAREMAGGEYGDDPMSVEQARKYLEREHLVDLAGAPFALDDARLVPGAGACTKCPKRTEAQAALFADMPGRDRCLDEACFGTKKTAFFTLQVERARAEGRPVLEGKAADQVITAYGIRFDAPFVDLDAECRYEVASGPEDEEKPARTYREILAGKDLPITVARTSLGAVRELLSKDDLPALLKGVPGVVIPKRAAAEEQVGRDNGYEEWKAQEKKLKLKIEATNALTAAVVDRVVAAVEKKFPEALWRLLARAAAESATFDQLKQVATRRGILVETGARPERAFSKALAGMSLGEARGLLLELLVSHGAYVGTYSSSFALTELVAGAADELGLDTKAIAHELKADTAAKAKPAKASPKKPAAGKSQKKAG